MIKLIKSTFYKEKETKEKLVKFISNSKQLSFGEQCGLFEKEFSIYQKRRFCIMVNSGSSANLALMQALINIGKLKAGDKVGFSAVTWSTNVMPLIQLGLIPIAVDVNLESLNVSSKELSDVLKKHRIKALFLTNLLGLCDDIDKIQQICKRNNILLIEDNCESLGSVYKGRKLGNFGYASTFSFYVGHHMSTIEGGAICTDDNELSIMLNIVRAHGWDRNLGIKDQNNMRDKYMVNSTFYSRYTFYNIGYNLRPTEIQGFLGRAQLKYINSITTARKNNFFKIFPAIYKKTDLYLPIRYKHMDFLSSFAIPIICKTSEIRNQLVKVCSGIVEIRPVVGGDITHQPFYAKNVSKKYFTNTPNAKIVHKQGLYFGNNPELTKSEIDKLIQIFTSI